MILEADWCVSEFLKYLDELNLADNTIVIFTSDNGPVLDDGYKDQAEELNGKHTPAGPFRGWKCDPYEGGTRIPMLVRWPGNVRAGSTSDALICQMDFCASFAGLLGQDYPAEDGVRLDKALLGKSKKGRESLVLEGYGRIIWIKEGDWACVPAYKNWKGNMTAPELYDLKKDVAQKHNIAAQYPKRVQEMTAKLEQVRNNKK